MHCLKRGILIILWSELLMDVMGSGGEWDILCLSHHKYIILLVSHWGVHDIICVSHILQLLMCSAAYRQWWTDCSWNLFWVHPPMFPKAIIFSLSPSQRWGSLTSQSRQYWPMHQYVMLTTPLPFKTVLLPIGATIDLFIDAFHISNDCIIDISKENVGQWYFGHLQVVKNRYLNILKVYF